MALKILYVATRWPWPIEMGRQRMIDQTLAFASKYAEVHLIAFADVRLAKAPAPAHIASSRKVPMSSLPDVVRSLLTNPGLPLQSHLFLNSKVRSELLEAIDEIKPDVVIFDMARLYSLARLIRRRHPKIRLVLDMDDRLSERYRRMLDSRASDPIGGTFAARLPGPLRALSSVIPKFLLFTERHLMARIERRANSLFDRILMVSPIEADQLNDDFTGAKAIGFPPLIEMRQTLPADFSKSLRFVFIGNAAYGPNAQALAELDRIAARVKAEAAPGSVNFSFVTAGRPDPALELAHVEQAGFVPDLGSFLAHDAVLVAPILTGTGIKTKIIDALEYAVPVVTTPVGAEGLSLEPGVHYLCAADEDAFVAALVRLVQSAEARRELETMARAARDVALSAHNRRVLSSRIRTALGDGIALPAAAPSKAGAAVISLLVALAGSGFAEEILGFAASQTMPRSGFVQEGIAQ